MQKELLVKAFALVSLCTLAATAQVAAENAGGRELINTLGCMACHQLEGNGGTLAPAFDGVGQRLTVTQIKAQITAPERANPGTMMPSFAHLPKEDLQSLLDFLATLK